MRLIESYLHGASLGLAATIGVLVEIEAETEDKSLREEVRSLAHEIAMQVAATNPTHIGERLIQKEEDDDERIDDEPYDLLIQSYIKDPDKMIRELIYETEEKIGAPIQVRRFVRYAISDI